MFAPFIFLSNCWRQNFARGHNFQVQFTSVSISQMYMPCSLFQIPAKKAKLSSSFFSKHKLCLRFPAFSHCVKQAFAASHIYIDTVERSSHCNKSAFVAIQRQELGYCRNGLAFKCRKSTPCQHDTFPAPASQPVKERYVALPIGMRELTHRLCDRHMIFCRHLLSSHTLLREFFCW